MSTVSEYCGVKVISISVIVAGGDAGKCCRRVLQVSAVVECCC